MIFAWGAARERFPRIFPRPLGYFFYLTRQCNLRCPHCWQPRESAPGPTLLDPDEWARAAARLPRGSYLGLSGGEPTLSPAFFSVVRAVRRGTRITVNTNGAAWTPRHLRLFLSGPVNNVSVSLDGFAPDHDRARQAPGLFGRVVENIGRLNRGRSRGHGPALTIKCVLTDHNTGHLDAFHAFCEKKLRADALCVSFLKEGRHIQFSLCSAANPAEYGAARLHAYSDPEAAARAVGGLLEKARRSRCRVQIYPRMDTPGQVREFLRLSGRTGYAPCRLPLAQVAVLPDGCVIPCLAVSLGNIRDHGYQVARVLGQAPYRDFCSQLTSWGSRLPAACHLCCYARFKGGGRHA